MIPSLSESRTPRRLSELFGDMPWSTDASLRLVRSLARQVHQWHEQGRVHGAITAAAVRFDDPSEPLIEPPVTGAVRPRFGDQHNDPATCPPFLADGEVLELPDSLSAAAALFEQRQLHFDARQIDVYQLGTLLCRLLTGEPVLAYMYDPQVKAALPHVVQGLLERLLASGQGAGFASCAQLAEAIDEALASLDAEAGADRPHDEVAGGGETPAGGSICRVACDDTPAHGRRSTKPPPAELSEPDGDADLPFRRLGIYTIVSRIGGGGMGDVYLAHDASLDRSVALKVLPAELARDGEFVRRFRTEASAVAKVVHPNVVPIYSIDEDAGHHFFSMHYVEGESLAARLSRRKRLPPDEAVELIRQCLAGLGAAHGAGLIHRDIKPGNILIERSTGRVLLVDFGLVRRLGDSARMTATGVIMGTVDYIAPEQARGKHVDCRTDLYSLGVMFYQILSGRLPFEAETPTAMMFQHAYEAPRPLLEAVPDTPPALAAIVARLMAKDPADRYQDAQSTLAALDRFAAQDGRTVEAIVGGDAPPGSSEMAVDSGSVVSESRAEPRDNTLPVPENEPFQPRAWRPVRDWAATMFRRHSPQFVQQLQSTTQQVDAAVGEYERRRERLARIAKEARTVFAGLSRQMEENCRAAEQAAAEAEAATDQRARRDALAQQDACRQHVEAIAGQLEQQKAQLDDIELQMSRADATLARLRSQRDLLNARWKAVEARKRSQQGLPAPRRRLRRLAFWVMVGACCLGAAFLLVLVTRPNPPSARGKAGVTESLPPKPLLPGSVSGMLFEDLNSDGIRDAGEPALAGWTMELRPIGRDAKVLRTYQAGTRGLGNRVALAGDKLVVAAVDDDRGGQTAGSVAIFDAASGKQLRTILNPEPGVGEMFGYDIAVSGDELLVGVPLDDTMNVDAGTAYLFNISSGNLEQSYVVPGRTDQARAGYKVALLDDVVAVGAPGTPTSPFPGAVYLFDRESGRLLRCLNNPTPQGGDCFGAQIAEINGNLLVGAADDDTLGKDAGAAYLFDPASGELRRTFFSPFRTRGPGGLFGFSIVNLGGLAAISMPGYDRRAEDCGAIYLFDTLSGSPVATFQNPVPIANSRFGTSMAAVGRDLLVGCPRFSPDGQNRVGAAYLLDGATGAMLLRLVNPTPETSHYFGWSVAAMGDNLLVSANKGPNDFPGNGIVYLFEGAARPITTVTDSEGHYHFDDAAGGTYEILYQVPKGFGPANPQQRSRSIMVGGVQDLSHADFGVSKSPISNAGRSEPPEASVGLR